jgi:hypothetical protein
VRRKSRPNPIPILSKSIHKMTGRETNFIVKSFRPPTVVSGQINPDWDSLQANHMSTSSKTDNLICSFRPLTTFNRLDTTVIALHTS